MSDYHQFCGLARALDLIGDRWSMLVIRELLIADRRHSELKSALPGIATNLLSDRLHHLSAVGVIERREESGRKAVTYALTPYGRQLRQPILGLVAWGAQSMSAGPRPGDSIQQSWLLLAIEAVLTERISTQTHATVGIRADGSPFTLAISEGTVEVTPGRVAEPDAEIDGPTAVILGVFSRAIPLTEAPSFGTVIDDPRGQLRELL